MNPTNKKCTARENVSGSLKLILSDTSIRPTATKERTSGKYRGKVRLSKQGNSRLRALLYMPAVVAKRFNPDIKACCERLLARGKSPMQTIGAAMRRLVHICFGVLKHQTVYQARTVDF
ncbi:transposase [Neisseria sp. Dent CA1/247]|uniref:transposase n=1 Tax=Neisseria sp. Dent CA1/247 TaxID=2912675 RepID=UPI00351DD759